MRRHIIREKVLQALYAHEISGDPAEHVIEHNIVGLGGHPSEYEFAKQLVMRTIEHDARIDKVIKEKVANWDFKRIAVVDRLILRMAICEFMYFTDIPPKVSVNEAIELAKHFSTEKSGQFVNGVLDAVLGDMKNAGEIHKSGRGLFDGEHTPGTGETHPQKKA